MELGNLTLTDLRKLHAKIESEIRRRSDTTRRDLFKRMQKMAAEQGLSLDEIISSGAVAEKTPARAAKPTRQKKAAKAKTPSVIKYRNPANPEQGWSGRGRKPQWALDLIAQGRSLEEAAVPVAA